MRRCGMNATKDRSHEVSASPSDQEGGGAYMNGTSRPMHAMRASGPDPASLSYDVVEVPDPAPRELLVQVRATAVTAGELDWPESWPAIPCHDMSGGVAPAGAADTGWPGGPWVYTLEGVDPARAPPHSQATSPALPAPKPPTVPHA